MPANLRIATEVVPIAAKREEGENVHDDEGGSKFYRYQNY